MTMSRTVLITGISSGIGREAALLLASKGFRIFGGVRQKTIGLQGVELIRLDVTDDASVTEAVREITANAGPIDGSSIMPAMAWSVVSRKLALLRPANSLRLTFSAWSE